MTEVRAPERLPDALTILDEGRQQLPLLVVGILLCLDLRPSVLRRVIHNIQNVIHYTAIADFHTVSYTHLTLPTIA